MRVDPIESEPLYHFHPSASVLRPGLLLSSAIVAEARRTGARCVALPADPGPHVPKVVDAARSCRQQGLLVIGGMTGQSASVGLGVSLSALDAATVDLSSSVSTALCRATLARLRGMLDGVKTWIEIVVRFAPGQASSRRSLEQMCRSIADVLGPDVPVHFDGLGVEIDELRYTQQIAVSNGLHWVYVDLRGDARGQGSWCPRCDALLVSRAGSISWPGLSGGACAACGWRFPGRFAWGDVPGTVGNRPSQIAAAR